MFDKIKQVGKKERDKHFDIALPINIEVFIRSYMAW